MPRPRLERPASAPRHNVNVFCQVKVTCPVRSHHQVLPKSNTYSPERTALQTRSPCPPGHSSSSGEVLGLSGRPQLSSTMLSKRLGPANPEASRGKASTWMNAGTKPSARQRAWSAPPLRACRGKSRLLTQPMPRGTIQRCFSPGAAYFPMPFSRGRVDSHFNRCCITRDSGPGRLPCAS